MSTAAQPLSIHLLPPLETGGVEAREGFDLQDHVAAGFCIHMLKTVTLRQVWCENQDDITLIWQGQASDEAEFVQVKSNEPDQLWSVAMLCQREKTAKNPEGLGTSIIERSLAHDRGCLSQARVRISEEINRIQGMLRPVRAAAASVLPPEISVLDMETGRLEERLQQLDRIRASLARRETLAQQIAQIQQEVTALEGEVRAQSTQIDFERASHLLQDGMNTYLNRIKEVTPNSWTQDGVHVRLGDRDVQIKVGKSNWRTKLGGTLTLYFLLSYHYSLMNLTDKEGSHFPGLTILDFPAKLEDGTQIKDKENFVVKPFVELLKRAGMEECQLIAAGSAFEDLQGASRIELTKIWK